MATSRSSVRSCARKTWPIPPLPSNRSMRYLPSMMRCSRSRTLLFRFQELDPVGIDHDVLARRQERHDDCEQRRAHGIAVGLAEAESEDGHRQQRLDRQGPATATAETARQYRDRQRVDYRGPEEFEVVGNADEGKEPDRGAADAGLREPERQCP